MTQQNIIGDRLDYQDTIIRDRDIILSPSVVIKDNVYSVTLLMRDAIE